MYSKSKIYIPTCRLHCHARTLITSDVVLALQALQYQKYSKASDVWSFGVLLYEIWSLGAVPYEGMFAMEIINFLKSGARLSPPPGCPRAIYELMIQSWCV